MKMRNRILAGLLSVALVAGEMLPVYAAGGDQEYAAEYELEYDKYFDMVRIVSMPKSETKEAEAAA